MRALTVAVLCAALVACGSPVDAPDPSPSVKPAAKLEILSGGSVYVGLYAPFNAELQTPSGGGLKTEIVHATWSSSDTSVLVVDSAWGGGFALGRTPGSASITATSGPLSASLVVTVQSIDPDSIAISCECWSYVGDTVRATTMAYKRVSHSTFSWIASASWTVSDPSKLALRARGSDMPWVARVVGHDSGSASISATAFGKTVSHPTMMWRPAGTMQVLDSFTPAAINDVGHIVGIGLTKFPDHPVLYQDGTLVDLGLLTGFSKCYATAINNAGEIVGSCVSPSRSQEMAFRWSAGTMTPLADGPGDISTSASAINDSGIIVGFARNASGSRAVRWHGGAMENLPTKNARYSGAFAVNASGQIVGWLEDNVALWEGDSVVTIAPGWALGINRSGEILYCDYYIDDCMLRRKSGTVSLGFYASALNDSSTVVGFFDNRPMMWRPGYAARLVTIPEGAWGSANAVNNRGQAVGWSYESGALWELGAPTTGMVSVKAQGRRTP
jgi:uncharacterized membrane protein